MGTYTKVNLDLLIKEDKAIEIQNLDEWLHRTPLYNPEVTPDYQYNRENKRIATDGNELVLQQYPCSSHPIFSHPDVTDFLYLDRAGIAKYPVWNYDKNTRILDIHAFFKNYDGQLDLFLDWISPFIEQVIDGEFNTDDDLEGPRYIKMKDRMLDIDQWSFTR